MHALGGLFFLVRHSVEGYLRFEAGSIQHDAAILPRGFEGRSGGGGGIEGGLRAQRRRQTCDLAHL